MKGFTQLKAEVIDRRLCTGCGTCVGMCPAGTLASGENGVADIKNCCTQCGICYAVCPGKEFSMSAWSERLFQKPYRADMLLGYYRSIWNAYSREEEIHDRGASGGVITQILVELLEQNVIEGAVAVRRRQDSPVRFEPFIAVSREQIIASAQSKYRIIPTNEVIRTIKRSDKKIAYVGLPCQIQGMRKAMERDGQLRARIVVLISLFCGFNMTKGATDYLIRKSGIPEEEIDELQYRCKRGNDTGFYIKGKSGQEFFVSKHGYTFLNLIFSPERCWKCFDYSGEFADISVGDAWEKRTGFSRVIIRTPNGEKIWELARKQGMIYAETADENVIIRTQNKVISYKKRQIAIRKKWMKHFPDYGVVFTKCSGKMWIKGMILYGILLFFKCPVGKAVIRIVPFAALVKISETLKGREVNREDKR